MAAIADAIRALVAGRGDSVLAAEHFEILIDGADEFTWDPNHVPDYGKAVACCEAYLDWLPDHDGGTLFEISVLFIPIVAETVSAADRASLLDAGRKGRFFGSVLRDEGNWLKATQAWLSAFRAGADIRRVVRRKRLTAPSALQPWTAPMLMCFRQRRGAPVLISTLARHISEE